MPISHAVWTVSTEPEEISQGILPSEQMLEDMIVAQPRILSSEWMLIGRQVGTGHGGWIDLLAIAPDGTLVVVELKRDKTPREVVAQALDYASWIESLDPEDVAVIYSKFKPGQSLSQDFQAFFGPTLDEDTINENHQVVIVAATLDASSERIAAREFQIDGSLALEKLKGGYHKHLVDDLERSEYFVPVEWVHTVQEAQAVQEVGMFGNQNTVCRPKTPKTPKWRSTVDRLKEKFGITT